MGASAKLMALVRATADLVRKDQGESTPLIANSRGDLQIAQALPPRAELVRMGRSWLCRATTPVAPVTALPTTTAQLTIYNGEPDDGAPYLIDVLLGVITTSAAAATGYGFAACMHVGKPATVLTDGGLAKRSLSGRPASQTKARLAVGQTVVDDGWFPVGDAVIGPANNLGMAKWQVLDGLIIVPPGHTFSMAQMANTGASIVGVCGMVWHEVPGLRIPSN